MLPQRGWCTDPSLIHIPAPSEPGWQITKNDTSQAAPSGYEGRTDTSTETAIGSAPATAGKHIVTRFTLGNKIETCPNADGTAEGEGEISFILDSTDAQANGTSTVHIEMRATAHYKGQVGDSVDLEGPVYAEIDFTSRTAKRGNAVHSGQSKESELAGSCQTKAPKSSCKAAGFTDCIEPSSLPGAVSSREICASPHFAAKLPLLARKLVDCLEIL